MLNANALSISSWSEFYEQLADLEKKAKELESIANEALEKVKELETEKEKDVTLDYLQVCEILGCTPHTLAFYRSKKGLPYYGGKPSTYSKKAVLQWREENQKMLRKK